MGEGPAIRARADRAQAAAARYFGVPHRRLLLSHLASGLSTGASLTDYYVLHRYIRVHRPLRILELGSGLTSVIMAHALQETAAEQPDGPAGHLDSMEDLAVFHADAKRLCPTPLAPFITFHLSEKIRYRWRDDLWSFGYAKLPEGPFDLVFVDGPTEKQEGRTGVCGDAFRIAERSPARGFDVMIDNKVGTCAALAGYFPEGRVRFDQALRLGFIAAACGQELRDAPSSARPLPDGDLLACFGLD